jgi:hypothetical protein
MGMSNDSETRVETAEAVHSRRAVLTRAAVGAATLTGAGALAGSASAHGRPGRWWWSSWHHPRHSGYDVFDFAITQEMADVGFLTEAIKRAPGTPSAQFLPALKSANEAEYVHVQALWAAGARPIASKIWVPDAAFGGGGIGLFQTIEAVETIELSLYNLGVDTYASRSDNDRARLSYEIGAVEGEHRVTARAAQMLLGNSAIVPDNFGFAPYATRSVADAKAAFEALGIGYDEQGAQPGAFYTFPGDPMANGTGMAVENASAV